MRLAAPVLRVDMSSAVVAAAYGGPEALTVIDQTVADPGPGEARVEIRASGVNPIDYKLYSGAMGSDPARLPLPLGFEAAGVVTTVGPDAVGPAGPVAVGDEVIAYRVAGGYAAELVAPAQALVPKPAALGWTEASGLMLAGATAWHALAATAVASGDTVLVHGASGGVGLMAGQLAVARGATVVGTASPARHDLLRELGVLPVTYGHGLADRVRAAAPQGIDAALDLVGTEEAIDVSAELVADRRRIATIAAARRGLELGMQALGGGPGADPGTELRNAARLELARLAAAGTIRVVVSQTFPLENAADAHRAIMNGHALGKIALIP
ncbi:MAG TPA: NADP-dependent oxidoreductase [Streptosporangiaceae bacterium]|nr:NADP-dependent oxidoreductase [Streptosporangiaceae bacterium]